MEGNITSNKKAEEIRSLYMKQSSGDNFTALVMSEFGMGKTSLICTGRKPILIDSFDPRGTVVVETLYPDLIEKGDILIRTFWNESSKAPTEYLRWERQWMDDINSNFLNLFGTYAIDSATTFIDALSYITAKKQDRKRGQLAISDYIPIYNTLKDIIKQTSSQACDFILTAHLVMTQDELTGVVRAEMDTYNKLKSQIPLLFTEKYVLLTKKTSSGLDYQLLTQDQARYRASTQLGAGGKLDPIETPDIKHILKKVGRSTEDKPSLFSK
jgi:hypothetical protein